MTAEWIKGRTTKWMNSRRNKNDTKYEQMWCTSLPMYLTCRGHFVMITKKKNGYTFERMFWQRITMEISYRKDPFQNSNLVSPSDGNNHSSNVILHAVVAVVQLLSRVQLFPTPWTAARQVPHRRIQFMTCCSLEKFHSSISYFPSLWIWKTG